jgi:hypothetical protein
LARIAFAAESAAVSNAWLSPPNSACTSCSSSTAGSTSNALGPVGTSVGSSSIAASIGSGMNPLEQAPID